MDKKEKLYERALATCVVMLIVCVILKLFGVQWFNLDTGIPLLNAIDRVVMESNLLSFVYSLTFSCLNSIIIICLVTKDSFINVVKKIHVIIAATVIMMFIKRYIEYEIISVIMDILLLYIQCISVSKFKVTEFGMVILLNILYQIISLFIRSLGVQLAYYGLVSSMILNFDYYIMLVMTYLYCRKGGNDLCGIFRAISSSLASQLWKKRSQNSKQCFDKEI